MTNREREFAALGVEYAEGIESVDKGFVYLGPEKRAFIFKLDCLALACECDFDWYIGWFKDTPEVIYDSQGLLNLFKLALNPPIAEPDDDGKCANMHYPG